MIDDKNFLKIIKYLFGFGDYTEMFSRIDTDTGLRKNGITIKRTEQKDPNPKVNNYQVTINWDLLEQILGDKE